MGFINGDFALLPSMAIWGHGRLSEQYRLLTSRGHSPVYAMADPLLSHRMHPPPPSPPAPPGDKMLDIWGVPAL